MQDEFTTGTALNMAASTPLSTAVPNPLFPPPALTSARPVSQTSVGHDVAQDGDLIEPEWVRIVKRVMSQHKSDPYNQSKTMTLLREDYLKKRYGRIIEDES